MTVEELTDELRRTHALAIDKPKEVASFVFAALKERVEVYPTENYYYFRFTHGGVAYAGNFRLDPLDRDKGRIHFAYYEEAAEWKPDGPERYLELDAAAGFAVERLAPLAYAVTHGGRRVVFELNDLSAVRPPAAAMDARDVFIGPIFDESALRFFLLYNRAAKTFHYVLDETAGVIERFDALKGAPRILVGRRTGFAFYRDHRFDRKILIGAFARNVRLNTYLDGPFDQLPENFIQGEALREAIIDSDPAAKGRIGRLGHYPGGNRYAIGTYMHYERLSDLLRVEACAQKRLRQPTYYRCFVNPPR
ncbi:MAG: hypothetical protein IPK81_14515 [Rhodospirillales bacterium]|nr:MAG: hypothetical protein IPK81_14515 [Rhodospirillales bacterium]